VGGRRRWLRLVRRRVELVRLDVLLDPLDEHRDELVAGGEAFGETRAEDELAVLATLEPADDGGAVAGERARVAVVSAVVARDSGVAGEPRRGGGEDVDR